MTLCRLILLGHYHHRNNPNECAQSDAAMLQVYDSLSHKVTNCHKAIKTIA